MRYLQREYDSYIINDSTFVTWKKTHPEDIISAEKEIQKIISDANEMIVAIDNKGVPSNYKINEKENWIIIFDATTAITMYEIKYSIGMSESCSSIIFSALLKEYKKLSEQYQTTSERSLEENNSLQTNLDSIDVYLKTLHQQIELLNQTKKIEQEKIKFNTIQMNNLKSNLDNLAMKIVKPQSFI